MSTSKRGPGFHHLAIRAFDYDATLAFYAKGLGCERAFGWGGDGNRAAMLSIGDGNYIEVFEGRKLECAVPEGGVLHYALRVDDAAARAVAAGASSIAEPRFVDIVGDRTVHVHIAFVKGLDGEVIEFFENDEL